MRQKLWADGTQKRLAVTSAMLRDMGSLKMMGLNEAVGETIQNERNVETKHFERWAMIKVYQNMICKFCFDTILKNLEESRHLTTAANIPYVLAPAATFGTYAIQAYIKGSESLNIVQVFSALSLIGMVSYPTTRLLAAIPNAASSIGCFDRVQGFLLTEPRLDERLDLPDSDSLDFKLVDTSDSMTDSNDKLAVLVENASIRPATGADVVISDANIEIRTGTTTMITGPVGAGKTVFLKALLGEITCDSGTISVQTRKIAYCSQQPWLQSGTVRQAIIGIVTEKQVDEAWYDTVIKSCALDYDISKFPANDRTVIGSRGITLSGGQRHRIALARALYTRCEIILLDDILSALDRKTESTIAENLFGSSGLFQRLGSTVIMVTHASMIGFRVLSATPRLTRT